MLMYPPQHIPIIIIMLAKSRPLLLTYKKNIFINNKLIYGYKVYIDQIENVQNKLNKHIVWRSYKDQYNANINKEPKLPSLEKR